MGRSEVIVVSEMVVVVRWVDEEEGGGVVWRKRVDWSGGSGRRRGKV